MTPDRSISRSSNPEIDNEVDSKFQPMWSQRGAESVSSIAGYHCLLSHHHSSHHRTDGCTIFGRISDLSGQKIVRVDVDVCTPIADKSTSLHDPNVCLGSGQSVPANQEDGQTHVGHGAVHIITKQLPDGVAIILRIIQQSHFDQVVTGVVPITPSRTAIDFNSSPPGR